ncbi:MAG: hypothetical protein ACJAVM_000655 [Sulfitobacter sp.]|jgi:Glycosyl transferase family 2
MKSPLHLLRRVLHRSAQARRRKRFARSVRHLHGPKQLQVGENEVVLIALVRNGSYYLDAFFDYYRALGVTHFVFFDNGSTDETLARIAAEPGTVIDQSPLPLALYEDLIRQYPAQAYGQDRWCLYVDMDEIFDFEGREKLGISGLISYLQGQGATAMVAQMLEMFPKVPLREAAQMPYGQVLDEFSYFDISAVEKYDYHSPEISFAALLPGNRITNDAIKFCFGGVRGKVFGETCCLTKHPLVFNGPDVVLMTHPHLSQGIICADISGVIKHYKFANDPGGRDALTLGVLAVAHGEDARRAAVMRDVPDVTLFSLEARPWNRVELLIRAGFLVGSKRFSDFITKYKP